MYGYEVILMSPQRDKQVGLRFISKRRHTSVVSLLRAQGVYAEYRSWTMLSFRSARAGAPEAPAELAVPSAAVAPAQLCLQA